MLEEAHGCDRIEWEATHADQMQKLEATMKSLETDHEQDIQALKVHHEAR